MTRRQRMRVLCWLALPVTAGVVVAGLMRPVAAEALLLLAVPLSAALLGLMSTRPQSPTPVSGRRWAARAGGALLLACTWAVVASWLAQAPTLLSNEELHLVLSLPVSVVLLALMTPRVQAPAQDGVADWIARGCWALSLAWGWTGWASWFFGPSAAGDDEAFAPLEATLVCGTFALAALLLAASFGAYGKTRRASREAAVRVVSA